MATRERQLLEMIRPFTGDHFTAKNGYRLNKPLNFGQRMAVRRYAKKVEELIQQPYVAYVPKKGQKKEAFEYTGQRGFHQFKVAIVHKPDRDSELEFTLDRKRPKGSRFVPVNKKTGQRYFHIPPEPFLDRDYLPDHFLEWLETEQGEDVDELEEEVLFEYLLEYYASDAEFYLIQASESYMWGAGGSKDAVAERVKLIIQNYGANLFEANDPNSSYYGNWFKGITGFTSRFDAAPIINTATAKRRAFRAKYNLRMDSTGKWRQLKDGSFGMFENNRMILRRFRDGSIGIYVNGVLVDRSYPSGRDADWGDDTS